MSLITKVTARVFGYPGVKGGGNPVTVFLWKERSHPSVELRTSLAQSCEWESVVAHLPLPLSLSRREEYKDGSGSDSSEEDLQLYFYMPSGEEVSFCAHAAMGAVAAVTHEEPHSISSSTDIHKQVDFRIADGTSQVAKVLPNNQIELELGSYHEESRVHEIDIQNLLDQIGLSTYGRVTSTGEEEQPPCVNSSVARSKTLLPVNTLETLHSATNPSNPLHFQKLCETINSTGIYLYCKTTPTPFTNNGTVEAYECRQFPKSSGYPEDPATGIAAAALAYSLYRRRRRQEKDDGEELYPFWFEMIQGTAMGKRSLIQIGIRKGIRDHPSTIQCLGHVEIDSIELTTVTCGVE